MTTVPTRPSDAQTAATKAQALIEAADAWAARAANHRRISNKARQLGEAAAHAARADACDEVAQDLRDRAALFGPPEHDPAAAAPRTGNLSRAQIAGALRGHRLNTANQDSGQHCTCGSDSRFDQRDGDHPWTSIEEHRADMVLRVVDSANGASS